MRTPMSVVPEADPRLERDRIEIDAAIMLVVSGVARQIRLINLGRPVEAAADGATHADLAGVEFVLDRSPSAIEVVVGPRR